MNFTEQITKEEILKAINKMGFETMSPIQEEAIPIALKGIDVIGHAKTGTGKTAAFSLPILETMDLSVKGVQALILAPTRELCKQVSEEVGRLGQFVRGLKMCEIYGGQSYTIQLNKLKNNPHIVVATPGRLIDIINRKALDLSKIKYLVLDEADEMLSVGFQKELDEIVTYIPKDRHTMLFSATFNDRIYKLSKTYLNNPTKVSVVSKDKIATTITQKYMCVNDRDRNLALYRLLMLHNDSMVMVFANTKKQVDSIVEELQSKGIIADGIHGDLTQKMRENTLNKFKKGITKVLVCSDVAARGLDIKGVDVVVNIDLPFEIDFYVHRVGRTGRANQTGIAYTILSPRKEREIKRIAKTYNTNIEMISMLKSKDVENIQRDMKLKELEKAISENSVDYSAKIQPLLDKGIDLDTIFQGLLAMVFHTEVAAIKESSDQRFFINVGKRDEFTKKDLLNMIEFNKDDITDIDIKQSFSFFTVKNQSPSAIIKDLKKHKFNKRKINVELANR